MDLNVSSDLIGYIMGNYDISAMLHIFTINEWMILGIIVGIFCSVIGCITGILIRCIWLKAKVKMLRNYVNLNDERLKGINGSVNLLLDLDGI